MARCASTLHFCLLVFTCVVSFRVSGDLNCYCTDNTENCNESSNYTCTIEFGVCYAKRSRNISSGVISMEYSCLQANEQVVSFVCAQPEENCVYECCSEDFCNTNLSVLLPSEVSSPPSAVTVDTEVPGPTPTPVHVTQKPTDPPTTSTTQSPSGGLRCYCNDTLKKPPSFCIALGYSCSGDVCYTKTYRNDGSIERVYSCYDSGFSTEFLCSGRLNNENEVHECCDSGDFCNKDLEGSLPIIKPETQSSVLSSPVVTVLVTYSQEYQSSVVSSLAETSTVLVTRNQEYQSSVVSSLAETSTVLVTHNQEYQSSVLSSPSTVLATHNQVLSSPVKTSAAVVKVTQSPMEPSAEVPTDGNQENSLLFVWLSAVIGGLMAIVFLIVTIFLILTLLQIRARKRSLSNLVEYPCNEATK